MGGSVGAVREDLCLQEEGGEKRLPGVKPRCSGAERLQAQIRNARPLPNEAPDHRMVHVVEQGEEADQNRELQQTATSPRNGSVVVRCLIICILTSCRLLLSRMGLQVAWPAGQSGQSAPLAQQPTSILPTATYPMQQYQTHQ